MTHPQCAWGGDTASADKHSSPPTPTHQADADAEATPTPAASSPPAAASPASSTAGPRFALTFLWLDKNVGVAVDAVYGARGARSPLTEFYMWPRKDAWEELKTALEARPWVPERDRVLLLNRATEVINYWQDEGAKHSVDDARAAFPDCTFSSS